MADVVFWTSGSTGEAKRIVRTSASLDRDARQLVAQFPALWRPGALVVGTIRSEHLYGALWLVRAPAHAGVRVHPAVVLSVEALLALPPPFILVTTPSFLEKALAHPDFPHLRGRVRAVVTSGSLLHAATSQAVMAALALSPLEIYGSTETGTIAFRQQAKQPCWTLVDGVSAAALPDGRLHVTSPFAMARSLVLGDRVQFEDARHFHLQGRVDRQVKILENFVSLGKVEAALSAHEFVAAVRVEKWRSGGVEKWRRGGVERLGALIVLSPAGVAALQHGAFADVAATLRAYLRTRLAPHEIPRRMRFVRALPVDARGKTTAQAVVEQLRAWCREPVVLAWSATASRLVARLAFPPDLECFQGHFPGCPILPGVAQLACLRHFARQCFADFPDAAVWRKVKFKKVILPGATAVLTVTRSAPGTFAWSLGDASCGEVVAS